MRAHFLLPFCIGCSDYGFNSPSKANVGKPDSAEPEDSGSQPEVLPECPEAPAPAPYSVTRDEACIAEPETGTFTPVVEWQWSSNPIWAGYDQGMSAPVVGHLNDESGDGLLGTDDIPEIVFASYPGSAYSSPGTVTAITGDGSATLWSAWEPGGYPLYGAGGVGLADLDGNGTVEVCAAGVSAAVVCLNGADGSLLWAAGGETSAFGAPAFADLEGDGSAEVIFGRQVFNADGSVRWVGTGGRGGDYPFSFAVDWDLDGVQEVVAGNTIYRADGSILLSDGGADGIAAVADLDGDGRPDLVKVAGGTVSALSNTGSLLWVNAIPGGGGGGPPTLADLDGDGQVEVGVAGLAYYTVFETDGSIKWSRPTEDDSSSRTGSSVFDFEGDGDAEIVYADEHNLFIYAGATGDVLMQHDGHASGTLMEYPVIADVDGDGATEIVVASNDMWWTGWRGITVLGDADNSWAPARQIWNQFAWSITNIEEDGGVPAYPVPNVSSWNNFRAGGTVLGPSHWRANLMPATPEICRTTCEVDEVLLWIPAENHGLVASTVETSLDIRPGSPGAVPMMSLAVPPLEAGGTAWLGPVRIQRSEWDTEGLFLRIDAEGLVSECDELDNSLDLGPWPCPSEDAAR